MALKGKTPAQRDGMNVKGGGRTCWSLQLQNSVKNNVKACIFVVSDSSNLITNSVLVLVGGLLISFFWAGFFILGIGGGQWDLVVFLLPFAILGGLIFYWTRSKKKPQNNDISSGSPF
jgi:hypothetical protein